MWLRNCDGLTGRGRAWSVDEKCVVVICCVRLIFCGESNELGKNRAARRGNAAEKVVWRRRRRVEGKKPNGCGADRFSALFTRPIRVGEALDAGTEVTVAHRINGGFRETERRWHGSLCSGGDRSWHGAC